VDLTWLEVSVRADLEAAEAISELLSRYGQGGTVIEQPLLPDDTPLQVRQKQIVTVKAYIDPADRAVREKIEEALWHLSQIYPFEPPTFKELPEQDWATAWRKDYQIQRIGEQIVIVPSWLEYSPQPDDIVLLIDPGLAFGTGLHPSTRLCLSALEQTDLAGKSVLDLGTGSGILAIYAAKRGAGPVVGIDNDAVSVKVAGDNGRRNGVAERITIGYGSLGLSGYEWVETSADLFPGPFQVIVVNILAEVIAALTPAIVAHLAPDGIVAAAGIIQEREELVLAAWQRCGLRVLQRRQEGDWVGLIGNRF
jgi:ribosomal protein L11 methyltransferase